MANPKLMIDTSVIIDFLRKKEKRKTIFWEIINNYDCSISVITHFELFCGANTIEKVDEIRKILKYLHIIDFNEEISFKASQIYDSLKRKNNLIEFRDIFIAAASIINNLHLATLNKKHFKRIEQLILFNL